MNSRLDRFQMVWSWQRVVYRALDVLEQDVQVHPEGHLDELAAESQQEVLSQMRLCRDELENFALLSLWALFEEAVNDWLTQRIQWAGVAVEFDQDIRSRLEKRVHHWSIGEKIDALKVLIGQDVVRDLHAVRQWRDWVAHRKIGARPMAVDFEMAQSLFISVLTRLESCPVGAVESLS